jgi:CubicO group peptidase (beta-lactamase class C family)
MMKGLVSGILAASAATGIAMGAGAQEALPSASAQPSPIMGWNQAEREVGFRNMEEIFPTAPVKRGASVHTLPRAASELKLHYTQDGKAMDADAFMAANYVAGLLVLQDGKILLEKYRLGLTPTGRWTSFSVAKSITSTLVGAAVRDGAIRSIDDPVTRYVPQLRGSAYDTVSIRQLMTMSSGVRWNEDYEYPQSDFMRLYDSDFIAPMMDRPRVHPAGAVFNYSTADTDILGTVVMQATGKPLSQYLSEKIWAPYGMEQDAAWLMVRGKEVGGANISMSLRDYGRFGEFIRGDGMIDGKPVLADGWVADATSRHIDSDWGKIGYGYQWWINPDGTFRALGIFGQLIYIDRPRKLVIVALSVWPHPDREDTYVTEDAFIAAVEGATAHAP